MRSPCKRCKRWKNEAPDCFEDCKRLQMFQTGLQYLNNTSKVLDRLNYDCLEPFSIGTISRAFNTQS